ncbi:galactose-binding domain-like protein [Parasitella parasitica]|nr:galactose-binding domain-like protein [Parasitella parasitica]
MGNTLSSQKHQCLKTQEFKETGFESLTEVSSCLRGAIIELVSDDSCGNASNLIKKGNVNRMLNLDDFSEETDGWLTKRHESAGSATVTLCNDSKILGIDIDTTGYIDSCPSFASVEGYRSSDMTWQALMPQSRINADSHNFFSIKESNVYSSVRLNVIPGGGIARFRVYGEISPDWLDNTKDYNLASANLGARIVRWTDQRNANNPNILLDNGTEISEGWLTPRSRFGEERNDFILIQLATAGILESIIIDTNGFGAHSPENVFIQGCYSKDVDPHYDQFTRWVCLVSHGSVVPADKTVFHVNFKRAITHIRLYLVPDGGIQQIKVIGKPSEKEDKQPLLIQSLAKGKSVQDDAEQEEEDKVAGSMIDQCSKRSAIEQLNVLDQTAKKGKRLRSD